MPDSIATLLDQRDIERTLISYANACDQRDWDLLNSVFAATVTADYGGEYSLHGREAVTGMIKSMLGGCGPTQHLLGNFVITVTQDEASCTCYVRAAHAGVDSESDQYYEVWAEYHDKLQRADTGWCITNRRMIVHKEMGSRDILKP